VVAGVVLIATRQRGASLSCQDFTTVVIEIGHLRSVATLWYDTTA
jgi:hypothetical protein